MPNPITQHSKKLLNDLKSVSNTRLFQQAKFFLLCCFLFSSCTSLPTQDNILERPDWEISGKIGIQEKSVRSDSSLFQWRQKDDQYLIHLMNGFGHIGLTIYGNNDKVHAQTAKGESYSSDTPEELLKNITGWHFP